jgi:hypothetical protein
MNRTLRLECTPILCWREWGHNLLDAVEEVHAPRADVASPREKPNREKEKSFDKAMSC